MCAYNKSNNWQKVGGKVGLEKTLVHGDLIILFKFMLAKVDHFSCQVK